MSYTIETENTIFKCTNPVCQGVFSVIAYSFRDDKCTEIDAAKMVPLTGNTPYYCPGCGTNLGAKP